MGDFSNNFLGVDNRIYGTGLGDSTTRPHDTLLENMLDSSTRWLVRRQHLAPRNFVGEPRRWASLFRLGIVYTPIYITPAMDSITVWVAATISSKIREETGGADTVDVYARLRLLGVDGEKAIFWTGDGTRQAYSITLNLGEDTQPVGAGWSFLELSIKSQADGVIDSNEAIDDWTDYFVQPTSPTVFEPGDWVTESIVNGIQFMGEVDYIRIPSYGGSSSFSSGYPAFSPRRFVTPITATSVNLQSMSWIEPEAAWVVCAVDDEAPSETYIPHDRAAMQPNDPVLGQATMVHENNIRGVYQRHELKAIGPELLDAPQTTWGSKAKVWPTVYASDTSGDLGWCSWRSSRASASVDVYLWLQFAHIVADTRATWEASIIEDARSNGARATWEITVDILQLENGDDWTTATVVATQTIELTDELHWLASFRSPIPILRRLFYSYFSQGDGATTGKDHYMWHEGCILEESGDMAVCVPQLVTLNIENHEVSIPLAARVTAEITGTPQWGVDPGDQDTEQLVCRCISMGISERGLT